MIKLDTPHESFIGGWYIDEKICDDLIQLFKDNKVTLVKADWTRPNPKINIFLEKYDRFGIPFNAFFANNFPEGLLLSELLSEKEMVNAINKIKNE